MKFSSTEIVEGIEVRGGAEFRRSTREALDRLKTLSQFTLVQSRLAVIRQGRRSGMKAWAPRPTFKVGAPTWRHSAIWYASAIAHDAYHAELYGAAKKNAGGKEPCAAVWTGPEAEKRCLAFQRDVIAALGGDENMLAYIDRCAQNPTYQGHAQGWQSWLDYLKRWW